MVERTVFRGQPLNQRIKSVLVLFVWIILTHTACKQVTNLVIIVNQSEVFNEIYASTGNVCFFVYTALSPPPGDIITQTNQRPKH